MVTLIMSSKKLPTHFLPLIILTQKSNTEDDDRSDILGTSCIWKISQEGSSKEHSTQEVHRHFQYPTCRVLFSEEDEDKDKDPQDEENILYSKALDEDVDPDDEC